MCLMLLQSLFKEAKIPLYIRNLYKETTDYEILTHYLGFEPDLNKAVHSVLRKRDDTPSLRFFRPTKLDVNEETIFFKDMATGVTGTTLKFIGLFLEQEYNLNYSTKEVVEHISNELGLGLFGGEKKERPKLNYILPPKDYKPIFFQSRAYTSYDLEYWKALGVNETLLKHYDVRSMKYLLDENGLVYKEFHSSDLAYVYVLFDKVKIYRPYAPKEQKFRNNCPGEDYKYYQGYNQLEYYGKDNSILIITKSMKDVLTFKGMALRNNILLDTIAPHAESNYINKDFLNWACTMYNRVIVVSDFDYQGVKFTQDAKRKNSNIEYRFLDSKRILINGKLKTINKDVADSCLFRGLEKTEKIFLAWCNKN